MLFKWTVVEMLRMEWSIDKGMKEGIKWFHWRRYLKQVLEEQGFSMQMREKYILGSTTQ